MKCNDSPAVLALLAHLGTGFDCASKVSYSVHLSVHPLLTLMLIGSRPSDHCFRSVCLFVCAEFFSAVFDPILIKLGHMLYVWF